MKYILAGSIVLSTCLVMPVQAGKPEWAGKPDGHSEERNGQVYSSQGSTTTEQLTDADSDSPGALIRQYFREYGYPPSRIQPSALQGLPPGLQKKLRRTGSLPPGWQRKLRAGQPLSGELEAFAEPLPAELTEVLPQAERYRRINDRVVRLSQGEGRILDVIYLLDELNPR